MIASNIWKIKTWTPLYIGKTYNVFSPTISWISVPAYVSSDRLRDVLGIEPEHFLGFTYTTYLHPGDMERLQGTYNFG